jgi:hypothetical protein
MKTFHKITLILLISLPLFAVQGFAQGATVTATGTVLAPLSVTGTGLFFGDQLFPGHNEIVARTDVGAARFDIVGQAGKEITATFTLPEMLESDSNTMPISFSATSGGHDSAIALKASATVFDPNAPFTASLYTAGEYFIWLGGTVSPSETQAAGVYTGSITLDTVYTGN